MPRLFVHGNPETAALWRPLLDALRARGEDDLEALSPPGFGAPVPDGFAASREAYRDWLAAEIESRGGSGDLVGHALLAKGSPPHVSGLFGLKSPMSVPMCLRWMALSQYHPYRFLVIFSLNQMFFCCELNILNCFKIR